MNDKTDVYLFYHNTHRARTPEYEIRNKKTNNLCTVCEYTASQPRTKMKIKMQAKEYGFSLVSSSCKFVNDLACVPEPVCVYMNVM